MRKYLLFLIVPAALVGAGLLLHAQDSAREVVKGKVLLLKTGHAIEGEIEKIGMQVCVRRGKSELWIANDKVIRLCADWDDAFAYAQTQIKQDDSNDRLRLARWCHEHRLTDKALAQARIALELNANNAEAKQMVTLMERELQAPAPRPAAPKPAVVVKPVTAAPVVDVSFETQIAFAAKVQPILMNKCVTCHSGTGGGKFQLERVTDASQKVLTQRNLAAVLTQVNLEFPTISPLLVKAITPHGAAPMAPLKDRTAPPLQAMQLWITETVAKNPQLKEHEALKKQTGSVLPAPKVIFPAPKQGDGVVSQPLPRFEIDEKNPPRAQPVETPRTPTPALPADEFDAVHFNAWAHPAYFQQQSASNRR